MSEEEEPAMLKALKEAIWWHEQTEDGTDEQIRDIFGQDTVDMLNRWRAIVDAETSLNVETRQAREEMEAGNEKAEYPFGEGETP